MDREKITQTLFVPNDIFLCIILGKQKTTIKAYMNAEVPCRAKTICLRLQLFPVLMLLAIMKGQHISTHFAQHFVLS